MASDTQEQGQGTGGRPMVNPSAPSDIPEGVPTIEWGDWCANISSELNKSRNIYDGILSLGRCVESLPSLGTSVEWYTLGLRAISPVAWSGHATCVQD